MSRAYSTFCQALIIAAMVGAGAWFASRAEPDEASQVHFSAASTLESAPIPTAVGRLDWRADGEMTLLTYGSLVDRGLTLYSLRQKAVRKVADVGLGPVTLARLSADGRHVLAATNRGALWWIDVNSPDSLTNIAELPGSKVFRTIAQAGDGERIAVESTADSIYLCDWKRDSAVVHLLDSGSPVTDIRFSESGLRLVSAHADGSLRVWEVATGEVLAEFGGHDSAAFAAAFLADGERIISAGTDDTLRMWEIASGNELWRRETEHLGALSLAVSADGRLAASGGQNHHIVVWNVAREESSFEIFTTASAVSHLNFSPDGSVLAAVEMDDEKSVRLYDMQHGKLVQRISMDGESIP